MKKFTSDRVKDFFEKPYTMYQKYSKNTAQAFKESFNAYFWKKIDRQKRKKELEQLLIKYAEVKEAQKNNKKWNQENKNFLASLADIQQKYSAILDEEKNEKEKRLEEQRTVEAEAEQRKQDAEGWKGTGSYLLAALLATGSLVGAFAGFSKYSNNPASLKYLTFASLCFFLAIVAILSESSQLSHLKAKKDLLNREEYEALGLSPDEEYRFIEEYNKKYKTSLTIGAFFGLITFTLVLTSGSFAVQGSNPSKTPAGMILGAGILCAIAIAYAIYTEKGDAFLLQSRAKYLKKKLMLPAVALLFVAIISLTFIEVDPGTWLGKGMYAGAILFMTLLIAFYCAKEFPKLTKSTAFQVVVGLVFAASLTTLAVSISCGVATKESKAQAKVWAIVFGVLGACILCYAGYNLLNRLAQVDEKREKEKEVEKEILLKVYDEDENERISMNPDLDYEYAHLRYEHAKGSYIGGKTKDIKFDALKYSGAPGVPGRDDDADANIQNLLEKAKAPVKQIDVLENHNDDKEDEIREHYDYYEKLFKK